MTDNLTPTPDLTGPAASREAAKYRRQLREVEAERDALAAQLDASRRAHVDEVLPEWVAPKAFWSESELSDLLNEDGLLDADLIQAGIDRAAEAYRLVPRPTPRGTSINGRRHVNDANEPRTLGSAIRGRR